MLFIANFMPTSSSKHKDLFAVRINFSHRPLVVLRVSSSQRVEGEELFRGSVADPFVVRNGTRSSCHSTVDGRPLPLAPKVGLRLSAARRLSHRLCGSVCFLCRYTGPSKVAQTCVRSSRTLLLIFDSAQSGLPTRPSSSRHSRRTEFIL